jgi:hypothetical protein
LLLGLTTTDSTGPITFDWYVEEPAGGLLGPSTRTSPTPRTQPERTAGAVAVQARAWPVGEMLDHACHGPGLRRRPRHLGRSGHLAIVQGHALRRKDAGRRRASRWRRRWWWGRRCHLSAGWGYDSLLRRFWQVGRDRLPAERVQRL